MTMTTIETRYSARGDSAAREDIRSGNTCPITDIDEGMVLQHLGLDDGGEEARAILRDAAERAERGGYAEDGDGRAALALARLAAMRGYRAAMREESDLNAAVWVQSQCAEVPA